MSILAYRLACTRANVLWHCGKTDSALLWEHIARATLSLIEDR